MQSRFTRDMKLMEKHIHGLVDQIVARERDPETGRQEIRVIWKF